MQENDRRFRPRFDVKVQVKIRNLDRPDFTQQQVESLNISGRGVYFSTDLPLDIGARVEMFLTMPVEIAGKHSRLWRCTGRVVRKQLCTPAHPKAGNGVPLARKIESRSPTAITIAPKHCNPHILSSVSNLV